MLYFLVQKDNMSITWGNTTFDCPIPINAWDPPYRSAVYSIMFKPDLRNETDIFQIIYLRESGNLLNRGFYKSHHKFNSWVQAAGSEENLYIGSYSMLRSNENERR